MDKKGTDVLTNELLPKKRIQFSLLPTVYDLLHVTILGAKQLSPLGVQLCWLTKDHPSWACRLLIQHTPYIPPVICNSFLIACGLGEGLDYIGQDS